MCAMARTLHCTVGFIIVRIVDNEQLNYKKSKSKIPKELISLMKEFGRVLIKLRMLQNQKVSQRNSIFPPQAHNFVRFSIL